jgi:cobalamin biosynthesis Mg chelatase CobN
MPGDKTWFIKIEDSALGPFTVHDLQKMVQSGELNGDDMIKEHDTGAYSRADTFEFLRDDIAKKRKKSLRGEEISIFVDKPGSEQKAAQPETTKISTDAKLEVKKAAKLAKRAQREQKGGGSHIWLWVGLFLVVVAIVVGFLVFQH